MKFDASGSNRSYDVKIDNFDIAFGERYSNNNIAMIVIMGMNCDISDPCYKGVL